MTQTAYMTATIAALNLPDDERGELMRRTLGMSRTHYQQVRDFHVVFDAPCPTALTNLSVTSRYQRLHFILSEFIETVKAGGFQIDVIIDQDNKVDLDISHIEGSQQDHIEMLDGLGDIVYVCYGMAIEMGVDLGPIIREIHASNMTKLFDGKAVKNKQDEAYKHLWIESEPAGKVLKGPDYQKPQIAIVINQMIRKEI